MNIKSALNILVKYKNIFKITGIIILIVILYKLDLNLVYVHIKNSDKLILASSILLFPFMIFCKSIRLQSIIAEYTNQKCNLCQLYRIYVESYFYGMLTPGKLGEFSRIFFIKKFVNDNSEATIITVFDRLIDVVLLLTTGIISVIYILYYKKIIQPEIFVSLIILIFLAYLSLNHLFLNKKILNFFSNKIPKLKSDTLKKIFLKYNYYDIMKWSLWTLISWLLYFFQIYIIALSLNIDICYYQIIIIVSVSSLIALIPVSISGFGTRDAAIITLMKIFGYNSETALSLSLLMIIMIYANAVIFYFSAILFIKKSDTEK